MAKNKKNNRECDFLCQTTETLAVLNALLNGTEYPKKTLKTAWMTLLLNQFHDIIPGSSIKEVYERSDRDYASIRSRIGKEKKNALKEIAGAVSEKGILVYNPNSFPASQLAEYNGAYFYAEKIPPMGWKVIQPVPVRETVEVSDKRIESKYYSITFDDAMNIVSLYDKENQREVVKNNNPANRLQIYEDYPQEWDNWEITDYYQDKMQTIDDVSNVKVLQGNGFGGFEITRSYGQSEIIQNIIVYANSRRIDFKTVADWHEHHKLLKASFATTVHTNKATYDIQFGNVERATHKNTSWDQAKFEVCAQK